MQTQSMNDGRELCSGGFNGGSDGRGVEFQIKEILIFISLFYTRALFEKG